MRRVFSGVAIAAVCVGSALVAGQGQGPGQDPFFDHGARGETIHVLPTPARLVEQNPNGPSFAAPSSGAEVFSASYGSGNLTNHGGHEIPNAAFKAIYWNSIVADAAAPNGQTIQTYIDGFINAFSGVENYKDNDKADYTIVQQYGASNPISSSLANLGSYVDLSHGSLSSISDSQIQTYLSAYLDAHGASSSTLYGIFFPAGTKVTLSGGASCTSFCGYHNHFGYNGQQIKYAVFPYPNCSGCVLSGLTAADMLTIVGSHEIREAVTDPELNAWYDRRGYEGDDKCVWHNLYRMTTGGFYVQPEYSNGGTVAASGFSATYPGPGCIVPSNTTSGGGGGGTGRGHGGHGHAGPSGQ
jgi:hypothetical protein